MAADARQPAFPSTRWSRILTPGGAGDLEALARMYWRPVHAYLRARLRCSESDADDVAQEAFAWILASQLLAKADPARGSFRGFLKRALANFAIDHVRRRGAHVRGGTAAHVPLDAAAEVADPRAPTPEQELDDAWRRELLVRAQAQLRDELTGNGRATYWALFRDYFVGADPAPDHATLAVRHGITRADVSNWLDHAKRRYRALLRDLVAETVVSAEEYDEELRWLFGPAREQR